MSAGLLGIQCPGEAKLKDQAEHGPSKQSTARLTNNCKLVRARSSNVPNNEEAKHDRLIFIGTLAMLTEIRLFLKKKKNTELHMYLKNNRFVIIIHVCVFLIPCGRASISQE